jgi:hypothetical protein
MNQQPDKLFREKLEGFQKAVPASAWNNVEARLNKKKNKGLWLKVAATLLLFAVAAFVLWPMNTNNQQHVSQKNAEKESKSPEKKEDIIGQQPVVDSKESTDSTIIKREESVSAPKERKTKQIKIKTIQPDIVIPPPVAALEKQEEKIIQEEKINIDVPEVETLPAEALAAENKSAGEEKGVTLILSAEQVNEKYLDKKSLAEATPDDKKPSTLRKLLDKAYDLKHNQDPFGDLRQKKNEILALNFRSEKQRSQNK